MTKPDMISAAHFEQICIMVVKLTELRQKETPNLAIENFSRELFRDMLRDFINNFSGLFQSR